MLFYLHDFDRSLLANPTVVERMREPIAHLRKRTTEIGSTRITETIKALLLVPAVSGYQGLKRCSRRTGARS